jgi:hypothetical protein
MWSRVTSCVLLRIPNDEGNIDHVLVYFFIEEDVFSCRSALANNGYGCQDVHIGSRETISMELVGRMGLRTATAYAREEEQYNIKFCINHIMYLLIKRSRVRFPISRRIFL